MASTQQSPNSEVAFIIVPGSFATAALYDGLLAEVRSRGYQADVVGLLSVNDGTRMPPAKMEDDAAHIRAAIISVLDDPEAPKNVVLAVHSYAGFPGTAAVEGLIPADRAAQGKSTAVTAITYLASFLPVVKESLRDFMGGAMPEPQKSGNPGGYMPLLPREFAQLIFNDIESPEEVARCYDMMSLHSSDSYDGRVTYEAWKHLPCKQIIPEIDVILPVEGQEKMYSRALANGADVKRIFVEGAGHCLTISRTTLVADEIVAMAHQE